MTTCQSGFLVITYQTNTIGYYPLRKILESIFSGAERKRRQYEKYRLRYVAFLDILGWKAIVDEIDTNLGRLEDIIGAYNSIKG